MRKILLVLVVALVAFVIVCRQRIYLWDVLATVSRDGVKQGGVRVMINYSNDVLIDDNSANNHRMYLVQNWDRIAKYAEGPFRCVGYIVYLACLADGDRASGQKIVPRSPEKREPFAGTTMTNKEVRFVDERGALVLVALR